MNWRVKAVIQNAVATLPDCLTYSAYYRIQRWAKTLTDTPMTDLEKAAIIATLAHQHLGRVLEIGTGRGLNVPMGLYLCGADQIVTVDINPYLRAELVMAALDFMRAHRADLERALRGQARAERFDALFAASNLSEVMATLRLDYVTPRDGITLPLADGSVDLHYSTNVLEHVPAATITRMLAEARRLLRPGGLLVHRIDLSDHFSHSDPSISPINFLQFSERRWRRIAGNRFMYHNRLRVHEFVDLFQNAGVTILWRDHATDPRALHALQDGLRLDRRYAGRPPKDLAITFLTIVGAFPH